MTPNKQAVLDEIQRAQRYLGDAERAGRADDLLATIHGIAGVEACLAVLKCVAIAWGHEAAERADDNA